MGDLGGGAGNALGGLNPAGYDAAAAAAGWRQIVPPLAGPRRVRRDAAMVFRRAAADTITTGVRRYVPPLAAVTAAWPAPHTSTGADWRADGPSPG